MVREFKLINEKGQTFSFMDIKNYCLLTSPEGLGFSYDISYERIGYSFMQNVGLINQNEISAELNFINYDNFFKFINYIESSIEIKLVYKPPFSNLSKTYYRDIDITSIGKSEISTNGVLTCPINMTCKSLWYEPLDIIYTVQPRDNAFIWTVKFPAVFTDSLRSQKDIVNDGHTEAPIVFEIKGPIVNPVVEVLQDNEIYASLVFTDTLLEGERITYSSKDTDLYIQKIDANNNVINLFDTLSLDKQNFFKLKKGANIIRVHAESNVNNNIKVKVMKEYKAV